MNYPLLVGHRPLVHDGMVLPVPLLKTTERQSPYWQYTESINRGAMSADGADEGTSWYTVGLTLLGLPSEGSLLTTQGAPLGVSATLG